MPRYFIEVSYLGTNYSGFQSQHNANTIQAELEDALKTISKNEILLTGSSRTDAGVHAIQNYLHFDAEEVIESWTGINSLSQAVYKLNAIIPADIAVRKIIPVTADAHCRFDALTREYRYYIYRSKNPFLRDRAYYFPYRLNEDLLAEAAKAVIDYRDFTSFSKRNTQVRTFMCEIGTSEWYWEEDCLVYRVVANRFLRGMVRALVATMLMAGRGKLTVDEFRKIIEARDCSRASFAVPGKGLFLIAVTYPENLLPVS